MIMINVDAICQFMCIRRYAESRSIFLIKMFLDGHLVCIAVLVWIILRRKNTQKHFCRVYLKMRLFNDGSDVPGKYQSWVVHLFMQRSPFSLIENFSAAPSVKTTALFIWRTNAMVRGRAQPCSTSFPISFSKAATLRFFLADLWFLCSIIVDRPYFLVASSIGDRWYWGPLWIISVIVSLSSWWCNMLDIPVGSRNSET